MKNVIVILFIILSAFCSSCKKVSLPVVKTVKYEIVSLDSVILTGEVLSEAEGAVIKRGFYWGMNPNPTAADNFSENESGPGIFEECVKLRYGLAYYFRSYALISSGTQLGEVRSVKVQLNPQFGTMTDSRNSKAYPTVTIHRQTWTAKNLAYLPSISQPWRGSETLPHYYVYDFFGTNRFDAIETAIYINYGVLYNWIAATTACPEGWHLPSDAEWTILTNYLGSLAGGFMKEAGTDKWNSPNTKATNISGFTALPGGYRDENQKFFAFGFDAYFWSASENNISASWCRYLYSSSGGVFRFDSNKSSGYSVRCLQN